MKFSISGLLLLFIACEGDLIKSPTLPLANHFTVRYKITGDPG